MIGAFTGQMKPAPETRCTVECDCAARILAARSALTAWRPSISSASARSCALSESRLTFFSSRARLELALVRDQFVPELPDLPDADGHRLGLLAHVGASALRLLQRGGDLDLRRAHLGDDLPVAADDQAHVVEAVDQVGDAVRREQDGQLVGRRRLVDRDHAPVEAGARGVVLLLEELQALGLDLEKRVQLVQLQLA